MSSYSDNQEYNEQTINEENINSRWIPYKQLKSMQKETEEEFQMYYFLFFVT